MPFILFAGIQKSDQWQDFAKTLAEAMDVEIVYVRTGTQALSTVRDNTPLAAILDQKLADMPGLSLVKKLLEVNAMICTAMVSDETEETFHEATEGLGILMHLPSTPAREHAHQLANRLRGVVCI